MHKATFIGQKIPLRTQKFIVLRRFFYQLYSFYHLVQIASKSKKKAFFQALHLNTLLLLRPRVRVVIASGADSVARVIFHLIIGITRVYIRSFYHVERVVYKSAVGTPYARGASFYNRQSALHTRAWWRSLGEHWHTRRARGGEKKQRCNNAFFSQTVFSKMFHVKQTQTRKRLKLAHSVFGGGA